ncbi:MAG: BMC domain-containing protein [Actinobacteria bacterium]|nr:BMC domain-containing protein [Actinomycetota bacterium]
MQKALGLIETRGLVSSIEAADTMLKTANVKLLGKQRIGAGLLTIMVEGDVESVKAAVGAGAEAARKVGQVVSVHVIPRPDDEIDIILPTESSRPVRK